MEQVIVDIGAAAGRLLQEQGALPERTAVPGEPLPEIPPQEGSTPLSFGDLVCQFNHPNPSGGKFCPECGLPVGKQVVNMDTQLQPPKPEAELTPEEKAQRAAEHQQALAINAAFDQAPVPEFQSSQGQVITVHFVDDGFTFGGHVWLRGQQISVGPDHPRWEDVRRWILLDTNEQIARYGKPYFAPGPVPREESAAEQLHQVEVRRSLGRRRFSAVPDGELLDVR